MSDTGEAVRKLKRLAFRGEIALCLAFARLLVSVVPMRYWRRLVGPIGGQENATRAGLTREQIGQAASTGREIARVARRLPFDAVCLPQAMAGHWTLGRRGIATRIVIGTRRDHDAGALQFHAWLMADDRCVTGADERETFESVFHGRSPE